MESRGFYEEDIFDIISRLSFAASAKDLEKLGPDKIRPPVWVCLSYNYNNGRFYTDKGFQRQQARRRALRKCRRQFYGGNIDDFFNPIGRRRLCRTRCFRWGNFQSRPFN